MNPQIKYELAHDILAARLLEKSKSEEAYHRLRIKELLSDRLKWHREQMEKEQKPYLLSQEDLSLIEPYIRSIRLSKEEEKYLSKSKKKLSEAAEEEKLKLKNKLKLQEDLTIQQKKVISQQKRSRRNIIIFFLSFFVVSIIFAWVVYYQNEKGKAERIRSTLEKVDILTTQDKHQEAILILETIKQGVDDHVLIDSLLQRSNTLQSLHTQFDSLLAEISIDDISNFLEADSIIAKANQLHHQTDNTWQSQLEGKRKILVKNLVEIGNNDLGLNTPKSLRDAKKKLEDALILKPNDPIIQDYLDEVNKRLNKLSP